jgi:hypothetical protein
MKSERYEIVLPSWLKAAVAKAAKAKGISMAEYIKDAIKEALKKDGIS